MNLKIKCDTPKEQVLVLRKFKKLVPECRWYDRTGLFDYIPFIEDSVDSCELSLCSDNDIVWGEINDHTYNHFSTFTASDFLRDDWKLEDKSELLTKLKVIQDQVNELEKLIKKESL